MSAVQGNLKMKVFGEDMRCPCVKGICVHDCHEYVQLQPDLRWMVVEVALLSHKCLCSAVYTIIEEEKFVLSVPCLCVCVCVCINCGCIYMCISALACMME